MNPLDFLFGQISSAVRNHASPDTPGPSYDANGILGTLAGLFGQHAEQNGGTFNNPLPSSQDPYGDPADQAGGSFGGAYGNVRPASEDPYGDPADQGQGGGGSFNNPLPASQDPYGDPADQR